MPVFRGDIGRTTTSTPQQEIFPAKAPAYWLVNLDARLKLDWVSPAPVFKNSYFQFNLYNAFDKFFVGGFGGGLAQSTSTRTCSPTGTANCPVSPVATFGGPPFVQIGAPRTAMASLNIQF
jgi:iron complex outermembrane recepter protein